MGRVSNHSFRYLIKTSRISVRAEDLHIAGFCLHYLSFGCFDADLTMPDIQEFFRQGYYSFEDYAVAHWLDHVDSSTSQPLPLESISFEPLAQKLKSFLTKHGLRPPPDRSISTKPRFQSIRHLSFTRELDCLANLARQRKSNVDYLDLEVQLQRRRLIYEDVVTNTNPQDRAFSSGLLLNASGWFKCPKKHCDFFFDGFANKEDRDKHVNQHERPFRCSFEECLHAKLGYGTEKDLKRHEKKSHPIGENSEWSFPTLKPKKNPHIFSASRKGDLVTVRRLFEEGADVNQRRPKGSNSALSLAVENNRSDVVKYLIEQGCKDDRELVVDKAVMSASISILQMVLEMEASLTRRVKFAQDALFTAVICGREEKIPLLLSYLIDINYRDREGKTALKYARLNGHHSCEQVLLDNGARDDDTIPSSPSW